MLTKAIISGNKKPGMAGHHAKAGFDTRQTLPDYYLQIKD